MGNKEFTTQWKNLVAYLLSEIAYLLAEQFRLLSTVDVLLVSANVGAFGYNGIDRSLDVDAF